MWFSPAATASRRSATFSGVRFMRFVPSPMRETSVSPSLSVGVALVPCGVGSISGRLAQVCGPILGAVVDAAPGGVRVGVAVDVDRVDARLDEQLELVIGAVVLHEHGNGVGVRGPPQRDAEAG